MDRVSGFALVWSGFSLETSRLLQLHGWSNLLWNLLSCPNSRNFGCVLSFTGGSSHHCDGPGSFSVPVFLPCKSWEIAVAVYPDGPFRGNCLTLRSGSRGERESQL